MTRTSRQSKILELISKNAIETQEELVEQLKKASFEVTQATISRDIKELGLIKIMTENKTYKYVRELAPDYSVTSKMVTVFKESVISFEEAGNIVVVKTLPGSANAASILIDKMNFPTIVGSVAGDDTIIIVVKSVNDVEGVLNKLKDIIG